MGGWVWVGGVARFVCVRALKILSPKYIIRNPINPQPETLYILTAKSCASASRLRNVGSVKFFCSSARSWDFGLEDLGLRV